MVISRTRRSSSRGEGRAPPNPEETNSDISYKQKCIICNNCSYKKDYKKSRICESNRANKFLKATTFFQDDIFTRSCDLQSEHAVFGADLYYHKICMQNYIRKYESLSQNDINIRVVSPKQLAWNKVIALLEYGLEGGKGYELNAIREHLNTKLS